MVMTSTFSTSSTVSVAARAGMTGRTVQPSLLALGLILIVATTTGATSGARADSGEDPAPGATEPLEAETGSNPEPAPPSETPAPVAPGAPAATSSATLERSSSEVPVFQREDRSGLVLGLKVGAGFGQLTSELGTTFIAELELGFILPALERNLELFVSGQYTAPGLEGQTTERDPRLPGDGLMRYDLRQEQLALTLGLLYRLPIDASWVRPYLALGGRLYLMRTTVTGASGGEPFGTNEETSMRPGFYGALGADFFVGPGALLFELQFGYASVDQFILRDTNVGALNLALGYRFFL